MINVLTRIQNHRINRLLLSLFTSSPPKQAFTFASAAGPSVNKNPSASFSSLAPGWIISLRPLFWIKARTIHANGNIISNLLSYLNNWLISSVLYFFLVFLSVFLSVLLWLNDFFTTKDSKGFTKDHERKKTIVPISWLFWLFRCNYRSVQVIQIPQLSYQRFPAREHI